MCSKPIKQCSEFPHNSGFFQIIRCCPMAVKILSICNVFDPNGLFLGCLKEKTYQENLRLKYVSDNAQAPQPMVSQFQCTFCLPLINELSLEFRLHFHGRRWIKNHWIKKGMKIRTTLNYCSRALAKQHTILDDMLAIYSQNLDLCPFDKGCNSRTSAQ